MLGDHSVYLTVTYTAAVIDSLSVVSVVIVV